MSALAVEIEPKSNPLKELLRYGQSVWLDYIRRNPGKSVLIAIGIGFAVGYLVRRREP